MTIKENLPNTVYSYHLMRFRPIKNIFDINFTNHLFDCIFFNKQIIFLAKGVQRFIVGKFDFESVQVLIPQKVEQTKIGLFLEKIDYLINFYQNKSEKLGNLKKSFLEKMFTV